MEKSETTLIYIQSGLIMSDSRELHHINSASEVTSVNYCNCCQSSLISIYY